MGEAQWQQVKEAFHRICDLSPETRGKHLEGLEREDPEVAEEVRSLLAAHESTDSFLESSAVIDLAAVAVASLAQGGFRHGSELGPYRIDQEIGRGGMGEVYRASRFSDFEQRVAIKVVRSSLRGDALRRFLDERQILARLQHPNIARLLDGGTAEDGTPYLVMEAIEGQPIDHYCDRYRLSIGQRIELLRSVCEAVHYAHQNLVVHRDLKPSNILVTADGVPKLLDFGIAALIDPEQGHTSSRSDADAQRLVGPMTPQYASPEQLRGEAMSTASDIYSLGVLAYRLLVGTSPYRLDTSRPAEVFRLVCETEPEPPSALLGRPVDPDAERPWDRPETRAALRRRLAGDLDAIVLMALRKNPQDRYGSAQALADDLRHHLEGRPVLARGSGFTYVVGRWMNRHRTVVAAVSLVLLAMVVGIVSTLRQTRIAEQQRAAAERRFDELRALTNAFLFEVHDAVAPLPGSTAVRQLVVDKAREYLERLAAESEGDPSLETELAIAWTRLGDVQGARGQASLSDTAGALASYRRALALLEDLAPTGGTLAPDDDLAIERQRAIIHRQMGTLLLLQGDRLSATAHHVLSCRMLEDLVALTPADRGLRLELARSLQRHAQVEIMAQNYEKALTGRMRALEMLGALAEGPVRAQHDPERSVATAAARGPGEAAGLDREILAELATAHVLVGDVFEQLERLEDALESFRKALELDRRLAADHPLDAEQNHHLLSSHARLGSLLHEIERPEEALGHLENARRIGEVLVSSDPFDARSRRSLLLVRQKIAGISQSLGRLEGAIALFRQIIEDARELSALDPTSVRAERDVAVAHYRLALALEAWAGKGATDPPSLWREARGAFEDSLEIFLDLARRGVLEPRDDHAEGELRDNIARCDAALGE